ncbi:MAG TPA: XdhC family protein [Chitinophagaceae bacterium]|jgi:xanthine dehydrogenase accessory factor|nr:XdhC family protein [Chitinophagaceae bacterium]
MNNQLKIWILIAKSLQQNIPVMLLYVLESSGSSPGRQGFFMAVNANGEMEGSIGGGIMEHKFVEMAKEKLKDSSHKEQGPTVRKQIHDKSVAKDQSGMICSGEQTIWLYEVQNKDQLPIQNLISSLEKKKNGTLKLSPSGIEFSGSIPGKNFYFSLRSEQDWEYIEKTGFKNQLFIIGGGHCALSFSKLMSAMDFYIRVYDERKNLKTMLENESAHEKHVVNDYSELSDLIPAGNNHYVVIMTFGYRADDIALRTLLNKEFKYLGLLGSKSKIEKMLEDYRKEGIEEKLLQRIHTPVGLPIKSQTPEEIAVSIAAEIIKVKNQDL